MEEVRGEIGWRGVAEHTRAPALGTVTAGFGALFLLGSADPQTGPAFAGLAGSGMLTALLAFLWARRVQADAKALRLSAEGLRARHRGRPIEASWNEVRGCRVDLAAGAVVLRVRRTTLALRPHAYTNADAIRAALRRWCPAYTLTESDEAALALEPKKRRAAARARRHRLPASALQITPTNASYREPEAPRVNHPAEALRPWRRKARLAGALTLFAGAASVACVVVGWTVAGWGSLILLGVVGAILTALFATVLGGARRAARELSRRIDYLGERMHQRVYGVWDADDGTRRWRLTREDRGDAWRGPHMHLEALDPDGTTRESYVDAHDFVAAGRVDPRAAWIAAVEPKPWRPTCFEGPPWELIRTYGEPRRLLLQDTRDGFVLTRFDDELRYAGDTWHATRAEVDRQLERELGATVQWRELADPPRGYTFLVDQK